MKIIPANYQIIPAVESERWAVLKHLERIGRVCYKSEDSITDDSCIKYIQNIADRRHWAMLEHHNFVMDVSEDIFKDIIAMRWLLHPEISFLMHFINLSVIRGPLSNTYLVSGSATAFNYLYGQPQFANCSSGIREIFSFLKRGFAEIFVDPRPDEKYIPLDGDLFINLLFNEEINNLPLEHRLMHQYFSVLFTVDRGVTHELVRHRPVAWAQESTRYCNYSKGKYNSEITVIKPLFFEEGSPEWNEWYAACLEDEKRYLNLLEMGRSAQEARSVLPQSTKADIAETATLGRWRHEFKMRVPKTAHPQMREVSVPLFNEVISLDPNAFKDLTYLIKDGVS